MNKHKTLWRLSIVAATLALYLAAPASVAHAVNVPWGATRTIDASFDGALSVTTADIDGDGDLDVLGAAPDADTVAWWENDGSGGGWTYHAVDTGFPAVQEVHTADLDRDGDLDVLGVGDAGVSYWANDGTGGGWTERVVSSAFYNAFSVYPADVDGDGDLDVLGANAANGVVWWANTDGTGTAWTQYDVPTFDHAWVVSAADVDRDGDLDILTGSGYYDLVRVYGNNGDGTAWTTHNLGSFTDPNALHAADLDGDGDLDVVGAGTGNGTAGWWENTAGDGSAWTYRTLTGAPDRAVAVYPADMDNDGDVDVLGTFDYSDYPNVIWWENDGSPTDGWVQRRVQASFTGAAGVCAGDLDGDGDQDVVATSNTADYVAWWENETIHRNAAFPLAGEHTIDGSFAGVDTIYPADVDNDGDTDLLGASPYADQIIWWENANGAGTAWTAHTVDGAFDEADSVYGADVDGDGDTDVLGTGVDDITWWENTDGAGTAWTEHTVDGAFDGVSSVYGADVDSDGDTDVLGAAINADGIAWWENANGAGTAWTEHTVDGSFSSSSVYASDVDNDGDTDVLGASRSLDDITWWENVNGSGTAWSEHIVDTDYTGAMQVYAADVDSDGDQDVLGVDWAADDITWWENSAGDGTAWAEHTVDGAFDGACSVTTADLDNDGDTDILGTASNADDITWWENVNGAGTAWTKHTVDGAFDGAITVYAADVDDDGDQDVFGGAWTYGEVAWWENRGGQFGLDTSNTAPGLINSGQMDDLLRVTVRHNGQVGDGDIELASLALLFEESAGDPLTSAEANGLVANLHIYRDDGSGAFDAGSDILVTSMNTLTLAGGVQTVVFADGDPNVQVSLGTPQMFFVVVELTADAGAQTPFQLRLTHIAESGTAQDRDHDLPLSLEYVGSTASGVTVALVDTLYLAPNVPACAGNNPCITSSLDLLRRMSSGGTLVILETNTITETLSGTGRDVTIVGGSGDVLDWDDGAGDLFTIPGPGTVTISGTLTLSCSGGCADSTAFLQSGGTLSATHITITGLDTGFNQTGGTLIAHANALSGTGIAFATNGTATVYSNTITGFDTGFNQTAGTLIAHTNALSGTGAAFVSYGTTTVYSNTVTGFRDGFSQTGGTLTAYDNALFGNGTGTAFASHGMATAYGNTITGFDTGFSQSASTLIAHTNTLSGTGTAFASYGTTTVYSNTVTGFRDGFSQTGGTLTAYGNVLSGSGTGTAFVSSGTTTAYDNTATDFANGFDHSGGSLVAYGNTLSGDGTGIAFASDGAVTAYNNTATGFANGFDHSGDALVVYSNTLSGNGTGTAFASSGTATMHDNTAIGFVVAFDHSGSTLLAYGNVVSGTGTAFLLSGSATVCGNTVTGYDTALDLSDATLTAYANNFDGFDTALTWSSSSWNLNHNWWGTAFAPVRPAGLDQPSWFFRLGAPVASWASGDGSTALGAAALGGGAGTAVIVSHGRDPADAPFGVGDTPAAMRCSDYYDFFTVDGSGLWTVTVPVDNVAACDPIYDQGALFWAPDTTQCTPGSTTCYDLVSGVSQESGPPRQLIRADLSTNYLYGTLFTAGDPAGENQAPTISDILNQATEIGEPVGPISFTVSDADDPATALTLTGLSTNPALVPAGNITFGGSGENRSISLFPSAGVTGTTTITVTVSDGALSAYDTFVLAVAANTPPQFTSTPVTTATVGVLYTYAVTVHDADPGDALTITAPVSATWLHLTQTTSRTATLSGTPVVEGDYPVELQVSDGQDVASLTATQSFAIHVSAGAGGDEYYIYLPLVVRNDSTR